MSKLTDFMTENELELKYVKILSILAKNKHSEAIKKSVALIEELQLPENSLKEEFIQGFVKRIGDPMSANEIRVSLGLEEQFITIDQWLMEGDEIPEDLLEESIKNRTMLTEKLNKEIESRKIMRR